MKLDITPLNKNVGVLLFPDFELLDVYGPLCLLGSIPGLTLTLVSENGGRVASAGGPESWATESFDSDTHYDVILVPGGMGTRKEVFNEKLLGWIKQHAETAQYCLAVCTGSALLAAAGVMKGKRATSNKRAYEWATSHCSETQWQYAARWTEDGHLWTSSGVSAGMDMTLGFIAHLYDADVAERLALAAEYTWHKDANVDPFAAYYQK